MVIPLCRIHTTHCFCCDETERRGRPAVLLSYAISSFQVNHTLGAQMIVRIAKAPRRCDIPALLQGWKRRTIHHHSRKQQLAVGRPSNPARDLRKSLSARAHSLEAEIASILGGRNKGESLG